MMLAEQDFQLFLDTVRNYTEYDLTDYSDKSLQRRLTKVLYQYDYTRDQFFDVLKKDKPFMEKFINEITVNTTELFRDPQIWHVLRYRLLPELAKRQSLRIWHAGCSTGQEVYSMMILLNELQMLDKTDIIATDINTKVLQTAQSGIFKYRFNISYLDNFDKVIRENPYNYNEHFNVPYDKYFTIDKDADQIIMHDFLRSKPMFMKFDLVKETDISPIKFDLILCRNVIIYFNNKLQNNTINLFHDNLQDEGCLLLGIHESIFGAYSNKFIRNGYFYYKNNSY